MKNDKGLFIKDPDFFRIPRKLKKKIPKNTFYCYTPTSGFKELKNGKYGYAIKLCPFYTWMKYKDMYPLPDWVDKEFLDEFSESCNGWCKLGKCEIDDQCKSCGLKIEKWNHNRINL